MNMTTTSMHRSVTKTQKQKYQSNMKLSFKKTHQTMNNVVNNSCDEILKKKIYEKRLSEFLLSLIMCSTH